MGSVCFSPGYRLVSRACEVGQTRAAVEIFIVGDTVRAAGSQELVYPPRALLADFATVIECDAGGRLAILQPDAFHARGAVAMAKPLMTECDPIVYDADHNRPARSRLLDALGARGGWRLHLPIAHCPLWDRTRERHPRQCLD